MSLATQFSQRFWLILEIYCQ